jgi:RimJ/RimL family protein N-acetyltransferase
MTNLQLDETMRGNDVPEADLFQGERVLLRAFEPGDIPELWRYLNDPGLSGRRYIPWKFPVDFPLSRKQAEEIYNQWSESEKETHLASGRWRRAGMWRGKYYDEILVDILRPEWVERGGSGDGA